MIKGMTVTLYETTSNTTDSFGRPIETETPVEVDNVIVAPTSSQDAINTLDLTGKKAVYTLAIPKGDTHEWRDRKVRFFNQDFHTFGEPLTGMDENIPLEWNTKVQVEIYE